MTPIAFILVFCTAAADSSPIPLDSTHVLFLDDRLIASMSGVCREIRRATKHPHNPLLRPDAPWEGKVALTYGSVLLDETRYRMWYITEGGLAYAESSDGLTWSKPMMDIIRHQGQKTNLVLTREAGPDKVALPYYYETFGVMKDPCDPDPQRRYKLGFLSLQRDYNGPRQDPHHRGQRRGLGVAGSPDGLRWTLIDNWTTEAICDGASHWMHDPVRNKYVLYGRTRQVPPDVAKANESDPWVKKNFWGRVVARVESPDFLHWDITDPGKGPVVLTMDTQDPPGTEIYSVLVFPYEGLYIGLVQVFTCQQGNSWLDIQLAVSHDGIRFQRVCNSDGRRIAFIQCGDIGEWDRFNNSLACNPPIRVGNELRFYYAGRTYRHPPYEGQDRGEPGSAVGLATVPPDRFVSLGASFDKGQIITKPLRLKGRTLHVNAKCDFGQILIEALDPSGKVVATARPIRADGLDVAAEWAETPPAGLSGTISLRITLSNARLYALWCTE